MLNYIITHTFANLKDINLLNQSKAGPNPHKEMLRNSLPFKDNPLSAMNKSRIKL